MSVLFHPQESDASPLFTFRWKHVGESFLAMYKHQTTCEPPRPSLGRRIDLSEYRDPNFLQNLPQLSSPVSVGQTFMLSSPSSSLPPVTFTEFAALPPSASQPQIIASQTTVEITTSAPPAGSSFRTFCLPHQKKSLIKLKMLLLVEEY